MIVLAWVGAIALGLFLIDRIALWAERRGWIYWRKKRSSVGLGGALTAFNPYEPGAAHIQPAKEARPGEERDNGDPPLPG